MVTKSREVIYSSKNKKGSLICNLCARNLDEECDLCQKSSVCFPGFIPDMNKTPALKLFSNLLLKELNQAEINALVLFILHREVINETFN